MRKARRDGDTARTIDIALVMHRLGNADAAQALLRRAGVPEHVVLRVLAKGGARAWMTPSVLQDRPADPIQHGECYSVTGRRRNAAGAALVQAAIAIGEQLGPERAARLLRREGLPEPVIERVLARTGKRRRRHPTAIDLNEKAPPAKINDN